MAFDANRPDLTLGVIGTGAMGRGIVQVAAAGGMRVMMTDSRAGAAQEAREFVEKMILRAAEKGSMTKDDAAAAVNRVSVVGGPADMKPCHIVVEAIVENLEAKQQLFAQLEDTVSSPPTRLRFRSRRSPPSSRRPSVLQVCTFSTRFP
jgi:3-hydroxybutyryl-CoA dehydrogenase